ncbi:MAG: hypothetical protein A3I66_06140 [Burkholderiales bacterium RIFCSPLOWO2_02_FULL_57_36]|nr:MAG: hypothetical protein A3I66_06140 [Burkholderiales bacterium RIFCSPLOWO2_02_FULL_57_36]
MTAIILDAAPAPTRSRIFSLRGRLGRAQYIAYSLGAVVGAFLFMFLAGLGLMLSGQLGRLLYIVVSVLLFYGFLPIFFTILTIKRAHDFNAGGWLALLLLVPVVNLLFWFVPGTRGENAYGAAPQAASTGLKLIAAALPVLLLLAFLATGGPQAIRQTGASPATQPSTSLKPYTP